MSQLLQVVLGMNGSDMKRTISLAEEMVMEEMQDVLHSLSQS